MSGFGYECSLFSLWSGCLLAMWSSTVWLCTMSRNNSFSFLSRLNSASFLLAAFVASSAPKNRFQRARAERFTPNLWAMSYEDKPCASRSKACSRNFAICFLLYLFLVISIVEISRANSESNSLLRKLSNQLTKCSYLICGAAKITVNRGPA